MTQHSQPDPSGEATTASASAPAEQTAPLTRRELRERERAAIAQASASNESRVAGSGVQVVHGSAPIYTSRRALREAATASARSLQVVAAAESFEPSVIRIPSPSLAPATGPVATVAAGSQADAALPTVRVPRSRPSRTVRAAAAPTSTRPADRGAGFRRSFRKLTAGGALLFIGSLVVVTSLPAQAFNPVEGEIVPTSAATDAQQTLAAADSTAATFLSRDDFLVNDAVASNSFDDAELASLQGIADGETAGSSYGGTPAFPATWAALQTDFVQSPFPTLGDVRISSPFGGRGGSYHGGADLTPGAGTPILPIANGVVSEVYQGNNPGGGGYTVFIDHNIDGQFYQSWYAHMAPGSIQVEVGQVVDIETQVGVVGTSGHSTGPHLHLEIKNGDYVSFDPVVWLQTREQNLEP